LQLGDQAGVIKAFYALTARYDVLVAALGSSHLPGSGGTGETAVDTSTDEFIASSQKEQEELERLLAIVRRSVFIFCICKSS
jgi:hypothetical protein